MVDAGGHMVMPGLRDVHIHLGYGGIQVAFEPILLPNDTLDDILGEVRDRIAGLEPYEWTVGGIIRSTVLEGVSSGGHLSALDEARGGRPMILLANPCTTVESAPVPLRSSGPGLTHRTPTAAPIMCAKRTACSPASCRRWHPKSSRTP
ncbi:amidohydrolase family protein [Streptomyces chartreusis]|uniref:Amidohydrolase family protein n=1 Tax=Streptomyces chartreusis TaxID=1969 RepID=A0A7H8T0Y2_STRCX|nr:amidohydrolase family protein [Streptomyces chartreusis]